MDKNTEEDGYGKMEFLLLINQIKIAKLLGVKGFGVYLHPLRRKALLKKN